MSLLFVIAISNCFLLSASFYVPATEGVRVREIFVYSGIRVIHLIAGFDQIGDRKSATLIEYKWVSNTGIWLTFESGVSGPIDFVIIIYGKPIIITLKTLKLKISETNIVFNLVSENRNNCIPFVFFWIFGKAGLEHLLV